MLAKNKFQLYFFALQALIVLLLFYSAKLVYELYSVTERVATLETNRFAMINKAEELRQSSDLLTKFARQYAITGDQRFKHQFEQVLAIRDGQHPRPRNYQSTYWSISMDSRDKYYPLIANESLEQVMNQLPYSHTEKEQLQLAKANSDQLVKIELEAFNAIEGVFKDHKGHFTVSGPANLQLAQKLLFSEEYRRAKESIMEPIDNFLRQLNKRTSSEISLHQTEQRKLSSSLPALLLINFGLMVIIFVFMQLRLSGHQHTLIHNALIDENTGINNSDYFAAFGPPLLQYHKKHNKSLCISMLAIDKLHEITLSYGQEIRQQVLKHLADSLRKRLRKNDLLIQDSDERFLLLLGDLNEHEAQDLNRELCAYIAATPYRQGKDSITYSISIGWVSSHREDDLDTLKIGAAKALDIARSHGCNRVNQFQSSAIKSLDKLAS